MKNIYKYFFSLSIILYMISLNLNAQVKEHKILGDHLTDKRLGGLKRIVKERYLRVLTTKNSFDYYIKNGVHHGLQWEMINSFINHLNKKIKNKDNPLDIAFEIIPVDGDQLIPMLNEGKGDIIATTFKVTKKRQKEVLFTLPYRKSYEIILSSKVISKDFSPYGKTFHVKKSSVFFEILENLNNQKTFGEKIKIKILDESIDEENILELLSLGKIQYTLLDSYMKEIALKVYDGIYTTPLQRKSEKENKNIKNIAWAVRKEDVALRKELDLFLPTYKQGSLLGNMAYRKYFEDTKKLRSRFLSNNNKEISGYDEYFKKFGKVFALDWKLLVSMAYQESRFKQDIVNKWGAIGIFQIKQMTANEPYVNIKEIRGLENAENNIHAGVKYLNWIKKTYFDKFDDISEKNKIRMAIASYNAGPTTILRARSLAMKMGLNPNKWFRNVEMALLAMNKVEPVKYVSDINKRYVSYLMLNI